MTDDLIARLRGVKDWWRAPGHLAEQAARALEAQAREIERLRAVISKDPKTVMIAYEDGDHQRLSRRVQEQTEALEAQARRIAELQQEVCSLIRRDPDDDKDARIAELEAALKDLLDDWRYMTGIVEDDEEDSLAVRAARDALGEKE